MAIGDWHEFDDGYRFRETLHGPMTTADCVDCAGTVLVVQATGRIGTGGQLEDQPPATPRCSGCGRWHYRLPGAVDREAKQ